MKAFVSTRFGPPSGLELKQIEKPVPRSDEILIRVVATAINDYDWSMVRGKPVEFRFLYGITSPKHPVCGMELSGIVEQVGKDVTKFKSGDEVYGDISGYGFGTFAEFVAINEKAVIKKPEQMSFIDAASLPHASLLAYQALHDIGHLTDGMKVLINGGGGGVGMLGVQMCKMYDTQVTGVDTGRKLDQMLKSGFDHVIDYKKENFTRLEDKYDLILDAKSKHSIRACLKTLTKNGKYVSVGGDTSKILSIFLMHQFYPERISMLVLKPNEGLDKIQEMYLDGKLKCKIDGPYNFSEIPWAIQYFGDGMHAGKIVIDMIH